jgi:hypothetical protein
MRLWNPAAEERQPQPKRSRDRSRERSPSRSAIDTHQQAGLSPRAWNEVLGVTDDLQIHNGETNPGNALGEAADHWVQRRLRDRHQPKAQRSSPRGVGVSPHGLSPRVWEDVLEYADGLWARMQNGEIDLEDALAEADVDMAPQERAAVEGELRQRVRARDGTASGSESGTEEEKEKGEEEEEEGEWASTSEDEPGCSSRCVGPRHVAAAGADRPAPPGRAVASCIDARKVARGGFPRAPQLYAAVVDAFAHCGGDRALASLVLGRSASGSTSAESTPSTPRDSDGALAGGAEERGGCLVAADAFRLQRVMALLQAVCCAAVPAWAVRAAALCGDALLARLGASELHAAARSSSSARVGALAQASRRDVAAWVRDSGQRALLDGAIHMWKTAAWAAAAPPGTSPLPLAAVAAPPPPSLPLLSPLQQQQDEEARVQELRRRALLRLAVAVPLEFALLLLASPTLALRINGLGELRKCVHDAGLEDARAECNAANSAHVSSSSSSSSSSLDAAMTRSPYFPGPLLMLTSAAHGADAAPTAGGGGTPLSSQDSELQAALALSLAPADEPEDAAPSANAAATTAAATPGGVAGVAAVGAAWQRGFVAARLAAFGLVERLLTPVRG